MIERAQQLQLQEVRGIYGLLQSVLESVLLFNDGVAEDFFGPQRETVRMGGGVSALLKGDGRR
ncbi:MAG: hypothetical protein KDN22_25330 [Verrucomicrobiae bacterium]|nr:hypothetical protein [Verrucomicrobiae bacterium]